MRKPDIRKRLNREIENPEAEKIGEVVRKIKEAEELGRQMSGSRKNHLEVDSQS